MNIFTTSYDPAQAAFNLDDKRVIKMVLESAQMLSTALHQFVPELAPYKVNHLNHPCSIWTRESRENYVWLLRHMEALSREYTARYGKTHKCAALIPLFRDSAVHIPGKPATPHPNCSLYKEVQDVREAYKQTLLHKWEHDKRKPTWYRADKRPF